MEAGFNVDLGRLAALLPFGMRSASVLALLRAGFAPYTQWLAAAFRAARAEERFRLLHNGQVCYLCAALNARYRSALPGVRFRIGESGIGQPWTYARQEETTPEGIQQTDHTFALTEPAPQPAPPDPTNPNAPSEVYPSFDPPYATGEVKLENLCTFIVYVPGDLYYSSLQDIRHFVEHYRLVTRIPQYEPINS